LPEFISGRPPHAGHARSIGLPETLYERRVMAKVLFQADPDSIELDHAVTFHHASPVLAGLDVNAFFL